MQPKQRDHWEMMIPKMERPPAHARITAPPQAQTPPSQEKPEERGTPIFYRPQLYSFPNLQPRIPPGAIIGTAVAIVVLLAASVYVLSSGPKSTPVAILRTRPPLAAGAGDWIPDYSVLAQETGGTRRVSLVRGSVNLTDFRLQFRGTIQSKALACAFRVWDPNNFYVMKVEFVRPDKTPVVALSRFAVINGVAEEPTQIPLPMQTYLDTVFRVRLDAVGNHFTTWVQDEKVDEWTDTRLLAGGVGISNERNEQWTLQGEMNVFPILRPPSVPQ